MATQTPKQVAITLDRERHLLLDFNALILVEDLTKRDFAQAEAWEKLGFRELRALVFVCLTHEDPELTLEAVGKMLHPGNIGYVSERLVAVRDANSAEPLAEGEGGGEPAPFARRSRSPSAGRSRGSTSG